MRPFVQCSAVPDGLNTRIVVQVFDGDAKAHPNRLYHKQALAPIVPEVSAANPHVYALRCLMAAAWAIAAAAYPYPRDAMLEALDHQPGITFSPDWAGPDSSQPGSPPEPRGPRDEQ